MIAARIRYLALTGLSAAALILGIQYAFGHRETEALLCGLVTLLCMDGSRYVLRTSHHLQQLHADARRSARPNPWPNWCCEAGWVSRGAEHTTDCTRARSHPR